jgi:hypothetical protein
MLACNLVALTVCLRSQSLSAGAADALDQHTTCFMLCLCCCTVQGPCSFKAAAPFSATSAAAASAASSAVRLVRHHTHQALA